MVTWKKIKTIHMIHDEAGCEFWMHHMLEHLTSQSLSFLNYKVLIIILTV